MLNKDTIKSEITPHLSMAKRGFITKRDLTEVINAIRPQYATVRSVATKGVRKGGRQTYFTSLTDKVFH